MWGKCYHIISIFILFLIWSTALVGTPFPFFITLTCYTKLLILLTFFCVCARVCVFSSSFLLQKWTDRSDGGSPEVCSRTLNPNNNVYEIKFKQESGCMCCRCLGMSLPLVSPSCLLSVSGLTSGPLHRPGWWGATSKIRHSFRLMLARSGLLTWSLL